MPAFCCVVKCGSRAKRDHNVNFHRIPAELNFKHKKNLNELSRIRRKKWIGAIKREDLTEIKLKYALVCSKHFISGKPADLIDDLNPDWVPSLNMGYTNGHQDSSNHGSMDRYKRRKRAVIVKGSINPVVAENSLEDIGEILKKHIFCSYEPKRKHLVGLAKELEKNVDVICQIDATARGILAKDTKKAVNSLAQYFYYYAAFAKKHQFEDPIKVLGIFKDDHPIWILGLLLGPALASGFNIILQTGFKFASVTSYILGLAVNVGFPKNCLIQIKSYTENFKVYYDLISKLTMPVLFAELDIQRKEYGKYNFLSLIPQKAAMVVFQDADLDSTVENAIEAIWGYQGMLPWSVNTILLQESVFETFSEKLEERVMAIDSSDIAYPSSPEYLENQTKTVDKATSLGIEVFQKIKNNTSSHTIITGANVSNKVFTSDKNDGTVTLVPFRSIEEAIILANNRRQGLGASVWSENIGLVNEVARKLNVGNVWINGHGLFSPEIPLCPLKGSGNGHFGGLRGWCELHEYISRWSKWNILQSEAKNIDDSLLKAISLGNNASTAWRKTSTLHKRKIFFELCEFIETIGTKSRDLPEDLMKDFLNDISKILKVSRSSDSFDGTLDGYCVSSVSYPDPAGVLFVGDLKWGSGKNNMAKLILQPLFLGNSVIILTENPQEHSFFQEISKVFPSGLLTALPFNKNMMYTIASHSKLFVPDMVPDSDLSWDGFTNFTSTKNIWSNIGQSHNWSA